jgi:hypothetical protein
MTPERNIDLEPAARHGETGDYIDHRTGEPHTAPIPEPPTGHLWTNADVANMAEGRAPAQPQPHLSEPQLSVPEPHDLDLSAAPSNVDGQGVAHFGVIAAGASGATCGGCGQTWPCEGAQLLSVAPLANLGASPQGSSIEAAARMLGVDPATLAAKLAQ